MKAINEPARAVDVVVETDVLVVGSGPGGLAAALAAARAGARTALLDRNGCFGGNITQVGVSGFAWYGILILPTTGRYFHVPCRSLVPRGIGNLLVAGRSIGGDRVSHAAVRNMMCCAVSGQGAGVAAAVSLQTGKPFDRLDIEAVQTELRRQGARIQ
ncbi:MAG TPA: FAD-dependent oxidoreductase [Steroidobacteraceae bacterium]|nr:FAD-dependent oxidoreductase [Steroidobacteraceae bacterium]